MGGLRSARATPSRPTPARVALAALLGLVALELLLHLLPWKAPSREEEAAARNLVGIERFYADFGQPFVEVGTREGVALCGPAPRFVPDSRSEKNHLQIQEFPCEKPAGTFRVVTLGGSSTEGFGVEASRTFTSMLPGRLAQALPARIDAINAGIVGITTHQVKALVPRLGRFSPDLYVIYAGHNDFNFFAVADAAELTPRWVRQARALADRFLLYRDLRALLHRVRPPPGLERSSPWGAGLLRGARERPPELIDRVRSVPRTPEARRRLVEQEEAVFDLIARRFEENVLAIAREARSQGAALLVLSPVSRPMDPPIDSIHWKEMDDEQVLRFEAHWRRLTEDGHVRRGATVPEEALSSALALDDRYAHLRWLLAEALRRQGRLEESRVHYLAAMDLNPPSAQDRVPPRFVPVVDAAARASHAGFVDLWPVFAARARLPGLPDEDLFMDAIHPSPAGHALIADAVAEWARAARLRAPSGRGSP